MVFASAGCGSDDPKPKASPTPAVDLPAGVTLTAPSTKLKVGDDGTFVYEIGGGASSAVTATVEEITKGSIDEDFRFFTLDAESKSATPYYVTIAVTNHGPAGLGDAPAPFLIHDDQNSIAPPNAITGTFKPCPNRTLPASLLPGKSADICLVFLLPEGRKLISIDARTADPTTAIRWTP